MGKISKEAATISKPGKRSSANRRPSQFLTSALGTHTRRVGEVIHAYNLAHASLFLLFQRLGADNDYLLALELWHTAKTDRAQREMLEVIVKHKTIGKIYKNGILWGIANLNSLSAFRNDAAHTEMMWYYDHAIPGLSTKAQVRKRLEDSPFEQHWRQLRGDLHALANYLGLLEVSLFAGEPLPLTKRPRLQLARSTSTQTQKQRHRAKKAARERQRRSSDR